MNNLLWSWQQFVFYTSHLKINGLPLIRGQTQAAQTMLILNPHANSKASTVLRDEFFDFVPKKKQARYFSGQVEKVHSYSTFLKSKNFKERIVHVYILILSLHQICSFLQSFTTYEIKIQYCCRNINNICT